MAMTVIYILCKLSVIFFVAISEGRTSVLRLRAAGRGASYVVV